MHRLAWVRRPDFPSDYEPIDIHHVLFRSLGGSNAETNLIPLCPACHRLLHRDTRLGTPYLTDCELRKAWQFWCALPAPIQPPLRLGDTSRTESCGFRVELDSYNVRIDGEVHGTAPYSDVRHQLIRSVVVPLAKADFFFPYPNRDDLYDRWQLNVDPKPGGDWSTLRAIDVFSSLSGPVKLESPMVVMLARVPRARVGIARPM